MKFRIESKPSPLRQLDNFRQLKVALKPIKADEGGKFLDVLLTHCAMLRSAISKDFSLADQEHVAISCDVYFNIPLVSSASVGGETISRLQKYGKNGIRTIFENKKELGEYLQGLDRIPSIILPNKLELMQKIGDAKSKFVYELVG
ncbi:MULTISPECIES: hypothetical protein [Flavobacteriaceae]|jgi:hypothetical protein|uniref:Uncharacterized protein n=1 Tax=Flagellimonas nanhaiensis TaxID=2292706 RepID=A0A371JMQ5_9FLAO|nr:MULTISPECIES: hypothetical protein [Flavobacteriaceae]RDY58418.1 hypothetical protein DX873_15570 [Allomuricauda nanhaiensis]